MKQCLTILLALLALAPVALAQKYACINTDYVMKSIPDYANAQKRLDKYVADWTKELSDKAAELDNMRAEYEQESYLLPDNLKKRRQEDIKAKEQEIRTLQQQRFGAGGDLDARRAELLKPVQDRVYSAIERIAQEKNYAFIFDKAGSATVLYASKKYDISDEVLEALGIKPGAASEQPSASESKGKGGDKQSEKAERSRPSNPELRKPQGQQIGAKSVPLPLGESKKR